MQGRMKNRAWVLLIGVAFIVADQLVKLLALAALQTQSFKFGNDPVNLALALSLNPGAFLSVGAALPPLVKQMIFIIGVAVVVGWAGYWALMHWATATGKALAVYAIALGGAGNLIDRVFRDGHVVDYLIINVGAAHTGVFNLADIAITAGALALAWDMFASPKAQK